MAPHHNQMVEMAVKNGLLLQAVCFAVVDAVADTEVGMRPLTAVGHVSLMYGSSSTMVIARQKGL